MAKYPTIWCSCDGAAGAATFVSGLCFACSWGRTQRNFASKAMNRRPISGGMAEGGKGIEEVEKGELACEGKVVSAPWQLGKNRS